MDPHHQAAAPQLQQGAHDADADLLAEVLQEEEVGEDAPLSPSGRSTLGGDTKNVRLLVLAGDKDGDGAISPAEYGNDPYFKAIANHRGDRDGILEQQDWDDIMGTRSGPDKLSAIELRPDGTAEEVWFVERGFTSVIPTPIVYEGVFYFVKNGGIFSGLDAETGETLKRGRLGNAIEGYSASPVAADGHVYVASIDGKVSVVKPGREWEVVRMNDLQEGIYATPALSKGAIYLRTDSTLYRFEEN